MVSIILYLIPSKVIFKSNKTKAYSRFFEQVVKTGKKIILLIRSLQ